jgi:hypothetical protein
VAIPIGHIGKIDLHAFVLEVAKGQRQPAAMGERADLGGVKFQHSNLLS